MIVPTYRILATDTAWSLAGPLVVVLSSFVANACVARILPPDQAGVFFLIVSFANIAAVVIQFGMARAALALIASHIAREEVGEARHVIRRTLLLLVASCALLGVALEALPETVWTWILDERPLLTMPAAGIALIAGALALQTLASDALRGLGRIKAAVLVGGLVQAPLFAVIQLVILVAMADIDVGDIALAYLAVVVLGGGVAATVLSTHYRAVGSARVRPSSGMSGVLNLALPLWIGNLTFLIQTQSDVWIVNYFLSKDDVAVYSNALRLALLIVVPLRALEGAVAHRLVTAYVHGHTQGVRSVARLAGSVGSVIALPPFLAFVLAPGWSMSMIYGDAYAHGGAILAALAIGRFCALPLTVNRLFLELCGFQRTAMKLSLASAAAHLLASVVLCSYLGALGAAIANTGVFMAEKTATAILVRQRLGVWLILGFDRSLLSAFRLGHAAPAVRE